MVAMVNLDPCRVLAVPPSPCVPPLSTTPLCVSLISLCYTICTQLLRLSAHFSSFLFSTFLPSTSSPSLPHVSFMPQWSPYRLQTGPEHKTRRPSMHNGSGWMGQPRNTASSTHEPSIISLSILTSDMKLYLVYHYFLLDKRFYEHDSLHQHTWWMCRNAVWTIVTCPLFVVQINFSLPFKDIFLCLFFH